MEIFENTLKKIDSIPQSLNSFFTDINIPKNNMGINMSICTYATTSFILTNLKYQENNLMKMIIFKKKVIISTIKRYVAEKEQTDDKIPT